MELDNPEGIYQCLNFQKKNQDMHRILQIFIKLFIRDALRLNNFNLVNLTGFFEPFFAKASKGKPMILVDIISNS